MWKLGWYFKAHSRWCTNHLQAMAYKMMILGMEILFRMDEIT